MVDDFCWWIIYVGNILIGLVIIFINDIVFVGCLLFDLYLGSFGIVGIVIGCGRIFFFN